MATATATVTETGHPAYGSGLRERPAAPTAPEKHGEGRSRWERPSLRLDRRRPRRVRWAESSVGA